LNFDADLFEVGKSVLFGDYKFELFIADVEKA